MGEMAEYYLEGQWDFDFAEQTELNRLHRKVWTTKDRRQLHVSEMENSHLINTISFIARNEDNFFYPEEWIALMQSEIKRREK